MFKTNIEAVRARTANKQQFTKKREKEAKWIITEIAINSVIF